MSKYRTSPRRRRQDTATSMMEGRVFLQLLVCAAIICSFMFLKDTPLPNGKTPSQYVNHFLSTSVNLNEVMSRIKDIDNSIPASGNVIETPTAAPSPTPSPSAAAPTN